MIATLVLGIIVGIALTFAALHVERTLRLRAVRKQDKYHQDVNAAARQLHSTWVDRTIPLESRSPSGPATW